MKLLPPSLLVCFQLSAATAWEQHDGYRSAPITIASQPQVGFAVVPAHPSGITFSNLLSGERSVTNRNLLSGAGVAAGDFDGDGWCDLYFCGLDSNNALYRNLGNWTFENVTERAGVACPGQDSTGAAFADIDGDGALELLVNSLGNGTRVFKNNGQGALTDITMQSGVATNTGSMSMALADVDGDRDLDLYIANFRTTTIRDRPAAQLQVQMVNGQPVISSLDGRPTTDSDLTNRFGLSPDGQILEYGEPDVLYLNDGHGKFQPLPFTGGAFLDEQGRPLTTAPHDWGLSVKFYDFTGDGAPDIYVCNDLQTPDRTWVNDGHGRFQAIPLLAIRHTSTFSMGIDFGDLNRDGHVDFYTVDMVSREPRNRKIQIAGLAPVFYAIGDIESRPQIFQNCLHLNRGDNTFAEIAHYSGLEATEWSWHPLLLDVDLDGYEDVLVPNGQLRDFQNADIGRTIESAVASRRVSPRELVRMFDQFPGLNLPNVLFRNRGNLTFEDVAVMWGFDTIGISQGMALADLDNDGDLDVITNNLNDSPTLLRNITTAPRVAVRLKSLPPNTRGIGAKIKLLGGPIPQQQEMVAAGRYLSADDTLRVFAAGDPAKPLTIEVTWRNGSHSRISNVLPNHIYEISEPSDRSDRSEPSDRSDRSDPRFEDLSHLLNHTHQETPYDDFARQFLLPNMLSHLGPGATWADIDRDGFDDLLLGAGAGGTVACYRNTGKGAFQWMNQRPFSHPVPRDTTTLVTLPQATNTLILVGSSNFEDGNEQGPMVRIYNPRAAQIRDVFPGQASSAGPLALADIDRDGDLDLFVGGRTLPGRYPEPASSVLFVSNQGNFETDPNHSTVFAHLGLVSACVFSDLDTNGWPDLILACEWGPLRVFHNENGRFTEITRSLGLDRFTGWWNGVATGDLDGDGRPDIVASNWGLNTRYRATPAHPRRIHYGDFLNNGVIALIESLHDPYLDKEVPDRDLNVVSLTLPFIRDRFPTHQLYAEASVADILGEHAPAKSVEANTLASMVFFNRGDRFEARPIPPEAQFSPAFAVVVADFDGDGHEDMFLTQNFFPTQPYTMRNDAGRGLLLKGDGSGRLSPVPGHLSGILAYGDQRAAAVSDFDRDGRLDLVLTQNSAQTRLFRNTSAKPGLRIRLKGSPLNPTAVGAAIRIESADGLGPIREVQAGSGYWSQNSPVQIMSTSSSPIAIHVRWPDGKSTSTPYPTAALEIEIDPSGLARVPRNPSQP
jgi:hypothetical protein